jgi:hypothetical protein
MRGSKDFQPRNIEDIIEPNKTLYFKIRNYLHRTNMQEKLCLYMID